MPPTVIYSRNKSMALRWRPCPRGVRFFRQSSQYGISVSLPIAHRNSSKSIGYISIVSSSEGMLTSRPHDVQIYTFSTIKQAIFNTFSRYWLRLCKRHYASRITQIKSEVTAMEWKGFCSTAQIKAVACFEVNSITRCKAVVVSNPSKNPCACSSPTVCCLPYSPAFCEYIPYLPFYVNLQWHCKFT